MYNLLIVDDEATLVYSLYEYITRIHSGEYECLKATSALQALDIAKHIRVDIAVLDIEMPGMNGLELCRNIRELYPHCHVIFLTAYDRFEYAYAAAQQHRTRLLLKTEGYQSVLNMIREESMALDTELIRSFPTTASQANMPGFEKDIMPVLIRKPARKEPAEEKAELERVVEFFDSWFKDKYKLFFLQTHQEYLLFLMRPLTAKGSQDELKQNLELFLDKAVQASGSRMSLALADDWMDWNDLSSRVKLMRETLENAPEDEDGYIWQLDEQALKRVGLMQLGDELMMLEQKCDEDGIRKKIHEGFVLAEQLGIPFAEFVFRQFERIQLNRSWNEWEYGYKQMAQFASRLELAQNEEKLAAVAIDFAHGIFQKRNQKTSEDLQYAVHKANEFIRQHYTEDISLADIARYVCLSSSYLSRIYKKQTGMSTVNHIKRLRIEKATQLLETSNMKIQDVALAVGYNSSRYFLAVFRSIVGKGPTEYREEKQ